MDSNALQRIQEAKIRRLEELEVQAAARGNNAPPEVLTERDALRAELGFIDVVAGLVQRLTLLEQRIDRDGGQRWVRQQILNAWLALITIGVLYLILR
jgi:hypothetical protein